MNPDLPDIGIHPAPAYPDTPPRLGYILLTLCLGILIGVGMLFLKRAYWPAQDTGPGLAYYELETARHAVRSQQIDGAIAFIGDSQTLGLATSNIAPKTENFGISGDNIDGMLGRVKRYKLDKAAAAVIELTLHGDEPADAIKQTYSQMLDAIPANVPVIAVGLFPNRENSSRLRSGIAQQNGVMKAACEARPGCRFLDIGPQLADADGQLSPRYSQPDGIHLSPAGFRVWTDALRPMLAQ